MKILYVANARLPTEKAHGLQIMKTCEALARAGSTVELLVPERKTAIAEDPFSYYRVERIFRVRKIWVPDTVSMGKTGFILQHMLFSIRAALYARRADADVVYSRDPVALSLLGRKRWRAVWETHDSSASRIQRWCARQVPKVVAITEGLRSYWSERGIPAEHIVVAPDAVDLDDFANPETKDAARRRLGLPQDTKAALYIGRLDGWKGIETLLEASKLLPKDITVVVIGGEIAQVSAMAQKYPHVRFLGYRPYQELPDNQQAADVLVLPNTARSETSARFTSPLKLFTYMASGIPIVASDLPSIREVLDERSACLVAPDDPRVLAEGIERLLADPAWAAHIAREAAERVKMYSWSKRAETIRDFIRRA